MITKYQKGMGQRLSDNFTSTQLDCQCGALNCTSTFIDVHLIYALEDLWSLAGPFQINSGYRCKAHNQAVGGKPDSQHVLGKAADIQSDRLNGKELSYFANQVDSFFAGGIGTGATFIHVDVRDYSARWEYPILN